MRRPTWHPLVTSSSITWMLLAITALMSASVLAAPESTLSEPWTAQSLSLPQFEAASVKPSEPGNLRGATYEFLPGAGLRVTNGTLKGMLETAYDLRQFQIFGGPSWVNSERYDVLAKSPSGEFGTRAGNSIEEIKAVRSRLQALLAERFQLRVHRETKELSEYALEIGKDGPKLSDESVSNSAGIRRSCGQMIGTSATMTNLVLMLSRELDRPLVDRTGLTGKYSFRLDWTPETGSCPGVPDDNPSIFTALEEKLGLKLESIKGPVDSLVIDYAERPSGN
jgi:bla regulator protein blaR1